MARILLLSLIILLVLCLIGGLNFSLREGRFEFEEEGRAGERGNSLLPVRSNSRKPLSSRLSRLYFYLKDLIASLKYAGNGKVRDAVGLFSLVKERFLIVKLKIGPPHSYLFQNTPHAASSLPLVFLSFYLFVFIIFVLIQLVFNYLSKTIKFDRLIYVYNFSQRAK